MPDKNSSMVIQVSGENIIFRNFRGKPTQFTRGGDRSFCLMISSRLIRDQLAAKGCNIKKLKDKEIEFVNVAVRCRSEENVDHIWTALDVDQIDKASLEFTFYEYTINGKKGTRIYLKNARFCILAFNNEHVWVDIRWPGIVTCTVDNKNKTEETKMEKMTRAEVMGQLQMGIAAYEMNGDVKKDPIVAKLMLAMRNAIEYVGEVPKSETKVKTVTVKEPVFALPEIKQVIFNYPATVVIWSDDVKTVVECQKGDNYDMEKGLAMCICKRMMGNKSNFSKQIRKYTDDVKNVQTKKKAKEGTFEERKAARMAQAEANKTAKGKSKAEKKKILDETRKDWAPKSGNTSKRVVLTESYVLKVRKKMIERGWDYSQTAKAAGIDQSTLSRWISPNVVSQKNKRMNRECFNKLNKALGIRWKIEE